MRRMRFLIGAFVIAIALIASNNSVFANSCCGVEKESKECSKEEAAKCAKEASPDQKIDNPCAVCGKAVDCQNKQVDVEHGGTTAHLCCEGCASAYRENPDKYSKAEKPAESHRAAPPIKSKQPGQGYY
ncbi:MAG: YHS domain-containing protein [Candidatus Brocadiaceae bacterium]|nr:YHS domain-containing protein [Candidatus Brocadiaceae bacterium]